MGYKSAREMSVELRSCGMTQGRIAKVLGVSQSEVSRWQSGKTKPSGEAMLRLVELYELKVKVKTGTAGAMQE